MCLVYWIITLIISIHLHSLYFCNANICHKRTDKLFRRHRFSAVQHCQRSNHTQLDQANFKHVRDCAGFARKRMALAFNYAPPRRGLTNRYDKTDASMKHTVYYIYILDLYLIICRKSQQLHNCSQFNGTRFGGIFQL